MPMQNYDTLRSVFSWNVIAEMINNDYVSLVFKMMMSPTFLALLTD